MKNIIKGSEPSLLYTYRMNNSNGKWDSFSKGRTTQIKQRRNQVQDQLKSDQSGICAYCEIDLKEKDASGIADFRVEHFHPKSDHSTAHNWHLDWQNLLGCCHGGSQSTVTDAANRFTSPDNSCDVPKGKKNLDGIILNPLQLPPFPVFFKCERATGILSVNEANCHQAGINIQQAQNTLDELHLYANRLNSLRKAVLNQLNTQLQALIVAGKDIRAARLQLAQVYLRKNNQQHWPAFFSSIRSYLGSEAEQHLRNIGYVG